MKFYVYIYTDPGRGGEPFYVGKGCRNRKSVHLRRTDRHEHRQKLSTALKGVKHTDERKRNISLGMMKSHGP